MHPPSTPHGTGRPRLTDGMARGTLLVALGIALIASGGLALRLHREPRGIEPDPAHPVLALGSSAPDFSLPGADGRTHTLAEYADARVLAIVFTCNHCLTSEQYERRLAALDRDYRSQGVTLIAIDPVNAESVALADLQDSDVGEGLEAMTTRAAYRHLGYPYLYDGDTQRTAQAFGAVATPQIFIFDHHRTLRYEGRIDDNVDETRVKTADARRAIDALLAGQAVPVTHTPVAGCRTPWLGRAATASTSDEAGAVPLTMAGPPELQALRRNGTGALLVVNFWATWCGPCVVEFPDLEDTYQMYRARGVGLTTVSENDVDERPVVLAFLQAHHATHANLQFGTHDTYGLQEAFDPMMASAVPFTLLLAANGDVLYQEVGELDILKLRRAILANLPDGAAHVGARAYWSQP